MGKDVYKETVDCMNLRMNERMCSSTCHPRTSDSSISDSPQFDSTKVADRDFFLLQSASASQISNDFHRGKVKKPFVVFSHATVHDV